MLTSKQLRMAAILAFMVPKDQQRKFYDGLMTEEPKPHEKEYFEEEGLSVEEIREAARAAFGYES